MKTVLNKKKVSLPQIKISDCVPYTIVPQGVTNPQIPFSNPNLDEEGPSEPCKELVKNKAASVIKERINPSRGG